MGQNSEFLIFVFQVLKKNALVNLITEVSITNKIIRT